MNNQESAKSVQFEQLSESPLFFLDEAHTIDGFKALSEALSGFTDNKILFIISIDADVIPEKMLSYIFPFAKAFICAGRDDNNSFPADKLCSIIRESCHDAAAAVDVKSGIDMALQLSTDSAVICCGSPAFISEARSCFDERLKKYQRKTVLKARRTLTVEERKSKSADICRRIEKSPEFQKSQTVLVYAALPDEVDLSALLHAGKTFVYPKCIENNALQLLVPFNDESWLSGAYGIREPDPEHSVEIKPENIDLVICPCSGFDSCANRLGMGGGYYDRLLPSCINADIIAAAFEIQKLPVVKVCSYDRAVSAVYTEDAVYRMP